MPYTPSPNISIFEIFDEIPMNIIADAIDCTAISVGGQNNRVSEIREHSFLFGVDSSQSQIFPHFLQKKIQIQFHLAADHHVVFCPRDFVHLLDADRVDLIIHV